MIKIIADYHTHTTFSHGKNSIEDNVKRGIELGLKEIAISDHGYGHMGFGVRKKDFKRMRELVNELNKKYLEIDIKLGVEANVLGVDGTVDMDDETLSYLDFMFVGYHFGSRPHRLFRDIRMHFANIMSKRSYYWYQEALKMNTQAFLNALDRYDILCITHPGAKGPVDIHAIAKKAAEKGTCLEINNQHGHLTVEEIKIAMEENVQFMIGSDAHHIKDIGVYDNAIKRALEAGLTIDRIVNAQQR